MNGIHDLGGMDGFTLPERDQGRILAEEWERLSWGANVALLFAPGMRNMRAELEALPPEDYLRLPYYAKWLTARENMLLGLGLVTAAELANPDGPVTMPELPADFAPLSAAEIVAAIDSDSSELVATSVAPRFAVGDRVMARNEHPRGHTRMPRYVRGHVGTVVKQHGANEFQDALPAGQQIGPQHLYTVAIAARELWGSRGHERDTMHVELWEYHLEAA
jgi:nitrile hydratase